jgi:two-component system alkaline phosphatase synthesis response regulator PhoP
MAKILLIEDEESLNHVVAMNLEMEGFEVTPVFDGREALQYQDQLKDYQLIILDVMLPHVSGWDLCQTFKSKSETPILFVSAKGTSSDKIKGLKMGADDYLAKPFDLEELLLRVRILLQRTNPKATKTSEIVIGDKVVNKNTFEVEDNQGTFIANLSKREMELLALFQAHEGEVVARDFILDELWGKDAFPTSRTIDNYILTFRKIFEQDPKEPKYFHSIRGVGYKFTNSKEND